MSERSSSTTFSKPIVAVAGSLIAVGVIFACAPSTTVDAGNSDAAIACDADADCPTGHCSNGLCGDKPHASCGKDADCSLGTHCSRAGLCLQCLVDAHCPTGGRCINGACEQPGCESDAECSGIHCLDGECVDCRGNDDCPAGQICAGISCVTPAADGGDDDTAGDDDDASDDDSTVTPQGGDDADDDGGADDDAVDDDTADDDSSGDDDSSDDDSADDDSGPPTCGADRDCDDGAFCSNGVCVAPVCTAGETQCGGANATLMTCRANGTGWDETPCADGQTCIDGGCRGSCTFGQRLCDGDRAAVKCGIDGSFAERQECDAAEKCLEGFCLPQVCTPNQRVCEGNSVKQCNPQGTNWALVENCNTALGQTCQNGDCTP